VSCAAGGEETGKRYEDATAAEETEEDSPAKSRTLDKSGQCPGLRFHSDGRTYLKEDD